jgi:hypothetical protein
MSQSDLSHGQELGEVCGEVDYGPLQPYQTLDFGENGMFYVGYLWISWMDIHNIEYTHVDTQEAQLIRHS